jgi:hypothetical protein
MDNEKIGPSFFLAPSSLTRVSNWIVIAVCHVTRGGKIGWLGCSVVDARVIFLCSTWTMSKSARRPVLFVLV